MDISKVKKTIKKAIDVPLMDIPNITNLIMDTLVCKNKHFRLKFEHYHRFEDINHYIDSIVLAKNKEHAFKILKPMLDTIVIDIYCHWYDNSVVTLTLKELTIDHFDEVNTLYNTEYTVVCEPRVEYLLVTQDCSDRGGWVDFDYKLCEYKYKCKPQKEYVSLYKDRGDYGACRTWHPDERLDLEYNEENIENAQSCIQYLF